MASSSLIVDRVGGWIEQILADDARLYIVQLGNRSGPRALRRAVDPKRFSPGEGALALPKEAVDWVRVRRGADETQLRLRLRSGAERVWRMDERLPDAALLEIFSGVRLRCEEAPSSGARPRGARVYGAAARGERFGQSAPPSAKTAVLEERSPDGTSGAAAVPDEHSSDGASGGALPARAAAADEHSPDGESGAALPARAAAADEHSLDGVSGGAVVSGKRLADGASGEAVSSGAQGSCGRSRGEAPDGDEAAEEALAGEAGDGPEARSGDEFDAALAEIAASEAGGTEPSESAAGLLASTLFGCTALLLPTLWWIRPGAALFWMNLALFPLGALAMARAKGSFGRPGVSKLLWVFPGTALLLACARVNLADWRQAILPAAGVSIGLALACALLCRGRRRLRVAAFVFALGLIGYAPGAVLGLNALGAAPVQTAFAQLARVSPDSVEVVLDGSARRFFADPAVCATLSLDEPCRLERCRGAMGVEYWRVLPRDLSGAV